MKAGPLGSAFAFSWIRPRTAACDWRYYGSVSSRPPSRRRAPRPKPERQDSDQPRSRAKPRQRDLRGPWAVWLGIFVVAAVAAFSSAIKAPFVYDDLPSIQQNPTIRSLSPGALLPPAQTSVAGRPVTNLSFALNYAINDALGVDQRGDPDGPSKTIGYHVVNILLHVACGLLLFGVIRRTIPRISERGDATTADRLAGLAVLLWLVNPIQTEPLDYVVQRSEILVSVFYVATLYCAIRAWDATPATRRRWYALGVVSCALGMASKEVMITAPIVVLLYDRFVRDGSWSAMFGDRGRRWFYGGLFATGLLVLLSVASQARSHSVGFSLGVTWYEYFYTQAWAIARYLRLMLVPTGLTFDYGERPVTFARGLPGLVLLTACFAAALAALFRKRWSGTGFAGLWFFVILAPSSSFVPIKTEIAAERRVYLASAALFVLVVVGLDRLLARSAKRVAIEYAVVTAVAIAWIAGSFARGLTYASQESLYRDVIAKTPSNPRGYVGIGLAYLTRGPDSFDAAERFFQQATAVDSTSTLAWRSLALVQGLRGRFDRAVDSYSRVLAVDSTDVNATDGIAHSLLELRKPDAAIPYVERLGTSDVELLWSLGEQLLGEGHASTAVRYLEAAGHSEVPSAANLAMLAEAYAQSGRNKDAAEAAAVATASAGDTAVAYLRAGRAMLTLHRATEAQAYLQRALQLDSTLTPVRKTLDSLRGAAR